MQAPYKWQLEQSETIYKNSFLHVQSDLCSHPKLGRHKFFVLGFRDWVNITPVTTEGRILLVRQYRRGTDELTLEIPSGSMDRGETNPLYAARRELREETGHIADRFIALGKVAVNPAIQNNYCHIYLARDCVYDGPLRPDSTEELEVLQFTIPEVNQLIVDGKITHSLGLLGLVLALQHLR